MTRFIDAVLLLALVTTPSLATAQGRGGFGGGKGRGQRGQGDTTSAGAPRPAMSFTELVFAHRADLQLTDSETTVVGNIRMVAISRKAVLNHEIDSVKATMVVSPTDSVVAPTDSSRKAIIERRRALGAMLGDLHDVDVTARDETLLALTPDQQKKAAYLEEQSDTPHPAEGAMSGRPGRGGGGRRGGGMGAP
jgi:hypothetical protein